MTPSPSHRNEAKSVVTHAAALDDVLKTHGRLTLSASLYVALRVADEVSALHAKGQHAGAIPATRVRCCADGSLSLARGRYPSAAPELEKGEAADALSDVYEVASLIYRLLTGHRPQADFAAPSAINPAVDTSLDDLVMEALAADPALRPHSMDALRGRLRAVFGELDLEPSPAELGRFVAAVAVAPAPKAAAKVEVRAQRRAPPRSWQRAWDGDDEDALEDDLEAEDGGERIVRAGAVDAKSDRQWAIASAVFAAVMLVLVL